MYDRDHWKVHSKEKLYCCQDCNAFFGRDRDLVKHKQSQKHQKATQGLSIQSVTSGVDNNPRTLSAVARGKSPGSLSRSSHGRRTTGRKGPPTAASYSTSVADRGHREMEVTGDTGDEADGTTQLLSDSTAGGNLAQANTPTSRSRSVKRIRTISDIDTNNRDKNGTEAPKGPDTEKSFGASPIPPAAGRRRNLAPRTPVPPPRSNCSSSSLSPTQIPPRRRPNPHRIFNNSAGVSVATSSNVPTITLNSFRRSPILPAIESQRVDWPFGPADDRTTASSVMTSPDDYMQFINMDYDLPTTHASQQSMLWNTSGGDTLSTISVGEYPRDLSARSYGPGSDGG